MKIMKNLKEMLLMLVLVWGTSMSANAQSNAEKFLVERVKERVKLMNDYVYYMADKSNSLDSRKYFREKALTLFIGRGYEYEENGIQKEGVMMQTTSVNRSTVNTTLLRIYFTRLINLRYKIVKITSTDVYDMKVSELKKVNSDGNKSLYMCTCQYGQYFKGYGDNYEYKDITTKRVVCYVEVEKTVDGPEYKLMLGDVEAISTERIY